MTYDEKSINQTAGQAKAHMSKINSWITIYQDKTSDDAWKIKTIQEIGCWISREEFDKLNLWIKNVDERSMIHEIMTEKHVEKYMIWQ